MDDLILSRAGSHISGGIEAIRQEIRHDIRRREIRAAECRRNIEAKVRINDSREEANRLHGMAVAYDRVLRMLDNYSPSEKDLSTYLAAEALEKFAQREDEAAQRLLKSITKSRQRLLNILDTLPEVDA